MPAQPYSRVDPIDDYLRAAEPQHRAAAAGTALGLHHGRNGEKAEPQCHFDCEKACMLQWMLECRGKGDRAPNDPRCLFDQRFWRPWAKRTSRDRTAPRMAAKCRTITSQSYPLWSICF